MKNLAGIDKVLISTSIILIILVSCSRPDSLFTGETGSARVQFAIEELQQSFDAGQIYAGIEFLLNMDLHEQGYIIRNSKKGIVIEGGGETGLMYGGLELAELLMVKKTLQDLDSLIEGKPYIERRGLKFNVPLDIRTPSYQDAGNAAQNNILEMWNFEFWKEYLDMMARNRYNVLTLWNPHPFPSMLKLEEYPDAALMDVCGTSFPLDTDRRFEANSTFIAGCGVSQQVLDNLVVLKEISIEDKIEYWRMVMSYAKDRGVDVYFITWNIMMNSLAPPGWYRHQDVKHGDAGKYGINNDQENPRTIAYLRDCVKEFLLTYPDLAGIGVTAGENMENRDDEYDKEKWLWSTYGEGVMDAKELLPDREIGFIHRYWSSNIGKIVDDFFSKYPDEINFSFKYARARMYAKTAPPWADKFIKEYSSHGLKSWWNIRNDDIFHFRWGNPEYAAEFMRNIPMENLTAGYFMGSDGYVWGRESISKHPQSPRELEIDKHWYNFMLWGKMGYNPQVDRDHLLGLLAVHYPGVNAEGLYSAWAIASKIPSRVTSFHWEDWDWEWAVEGCLEMENGFHTVEDFITNPTMEGSNLLTIPECAGMMKNGTDVIGITPLQLSYELDSLAAGVLRFTENQAEGDISNSFDELVYDLKSFAWMGKYYTSKIRGAWYLYLYRQNGAEENKQASVSALSEALEMWKAYAASASRNYYPQLMAKTRVIDWVALTREVEKDIEIARSSK